LTALVAELGPHARAATVVEAAKAGDIVVVTIPLKDYRTVPPEPLAGKVVIDTNNYYPQRDSHIPELDNESTTTSELLQTQLPTSKIVKAFNHIYAAQLTTDGRPAGTEGRRALAIAGDDLEAKATVGRLIDEFGFDVVDAGPLKEGWRIQCDTPGYGPRRTAEHCARTPRRRSDTWIGSPGRRPGGPARGSVQITIHPLMSGEATSTNSSGRPPLLRDSPTRET